jgi:CheY-like chemotaxis protein
MEVSFFLQKQETRTLRLSYLENVQKKHALVIDLFNQLIQGTGTPETKLSLVTSLFAEMHRLKGSGGTFGFNEISLIYKELLHYIRPAYEKKEIPSTLDLSEGKKWAEVFSAYFPFLFKAFQQLASLSSRQTSFSIMIVNEDRRPVIAELEMACIHRKWVVYTLLNLEEASRLLKEFTPDLILLDSLLADGNGIHLCKTLKNDKPSLPVYILSPDYKEEEKRETMKAGATGYYAPPYDMKEILKCFSTFSGDLSQ